MKTVLICGYYGFRNMGDEALLKSVAGLFKEIDPTIAVEALSYNVKYTEEAIGVKGFSRKSLIKLIQKLWQVDCVVLVVDLCYKMSPVQNHCFITLVLSCWLSF